MLPISRETLVHGSCDGNKTRKRDTHVEDLLQPMFSRLGLARGPFDAEFHRVESQIYAVDL